MADRDASRQGNTERPSGEGQEAWHDAADEEELTLHVSCLHKDIDIISDFGGSDSQASEPMSEPCPDINGQISHLICGLFLGLTKRLPKPYRDTLNMNTLNTFTTRLSQKLQGEISINVATKDWNEFVENITKAVTKDLMKEFDSLQQLVEGLMALDDQSFEDAVVKNLKIHIIALQGGPPKRTKTLGLF